MKVSREIKKLKAIERMEDFGLYKPYINSFVKRDEIFLTEPTGGVYEFTSNTELYKRIKEFEEEYNALVYHVIHTFTDFGELYNFLYVSDYKDEWYMDDYDAKHGQSYAYVWNVDDELCSESGTIGVKNKFGGLVRTF